MSDMNVTLLERADGESLYRWADALRDIRPALHAVGVEFQKATQESVSARRDPWGSAWVPPSEMTRAVATRRGKTAGGTTFAPKVKVTIVGANLVKVSVQSKASMSFHNGVRNMQVFGRRTAKVSPARPILPIRNGKLDIPESLMTRVRGVLRDELKRAAQRR